MGYLGVAMRSHECTRGEPGAPAAACTQVDTVDMLALVPKPLRVPPALKLPCSSVQDAAIEEDPEEVGIVPASQQSEVLLYSEEASSLVRTLAQQDDAVRQHLSLHTDFAAKKKATNCCVQ